MASKIIGFEWPRIMGPHEPMKSMYWFSSSSIKIGPLADLKKTGLPSMFLNALTGEFTPPGINDWACSKSDSDLFLFNALNLFNYFLLKNFWFILRVGMIPNLASIFFNFICKLFYFIPICKFISFWCVCWPLCNPHY